jgi:crossover junction endodeoxyribonuclease RuvC
MRVFGIDPGSQVTGFALIYSHRGRFRLEETGCVRMKSSQPIPSRLMAIHAGLVAALERTKPDVVAIEGIFHHKSSESALRLGQARGVALLAAAQAGLDIHSYNPMTVKKAVGAHGRSDKKAVARVVSMLVGREIPGDGEPLDVADAAAIAITHCCHARMAAVGVR